MLLKTRFYLPPLRKNGVLRKTLLESLDQSQGGDLVVVSAPPGYGKSTLVSQWLHLRPQRFVWLSLGSEHNAEALFWQHILRAIQQVEPNIALPWQEQTLEQASSDLSQLVVDLLNELDQLTEKDKSDSAITLVLDDFHVIDNVKVLKSVNLFLDHLPSSIRLVVTAREQPSLKLAKRRASQQLKQLSADDLRFSESEAQEFFIKTMNLTQPDLQAAQFCAQTEGWIAGLQLIALSLRKPHQDVNALFAEHGLHKHIEDYLFDEVYQSLSQDMQQFLWTTALPQRFCAALSNSMTGLSNSRDYILKLEQSDLFLVPLDNHRTWYRYHDLFRLFLLQRAAQSPKSLVDPCLEGGLQWLMQQDYHQDALDLCMEQQRWKSLADLISDEIIVEELLRQPDKLSAMVADIPNTEEALLNSLNNIRSRLCLDHTATDLINASDEPLTKREQRVLELIAEGFSNKAIADKLHISLNTLKVHIRNLYGKMGVENRSQALSKLTQAKRENSPS